MAGRRKSRPTASYQSPGAAALRDAAEREDPAVALIVGELGETSFNQHKRGATCPGVRALDLYRRLLGLEPGAFLDGELRKRHERLEQRLASKRAVPS